METHFNTIDPNSENYFENFCVACDNFMTLDCPFLSFVGTNTKWKDIGCTGFWD